MINNIQILRAFAAINVVVVHALYYSSIYKYESNFLNFLSGWGSNGIDLFFVISGFIIFHTQINNKKNIFEFIKLRLARIVPCYWIITLFYIITYYLFPNLFNNLKINTAIIFQSLFFFSQSISGTYPLVNVGWTLEYEIFFYLLFSFFLIFKELNIFFINIVFFSLILLIKNYLFLEFLFGVNVAYFYNRKNLSNKNGFIFFIIGFASLILSIKSIGVFRIENVIDRIFYWGIPSLLIVLGLIYCKKFNNKFLIFLGNASYSIYLTHFIFIACYYKTISFFLVNFNHDLMIILSILLSISLGSLFYIFIEKPISNFLKNKIILKN